jgi:lycopene cyclase CruP
MSLVEQLLSSVPGSPLELLRRADQSLMQLRQGTRSIPEVIQQSDRPLTSLDWDVVISGGTLGIFIGAALAQRGWRVALLERGKLQGRAQEWNISRQELTVLRELNLLTATELEQAIASEYNPVRISFLGGEDLWVKDVLNIGVDPVLLLELLKTRFLAAGGQLFEHTAFSGATLHANGLTVQAGEATFTTRLLLDAMGHQSPIVAQTRQGKPPDAVCLVVGTCAQGIPNNQTADLLVSRTPLQRQCQYFWEAFPARDGRTTYLFTYLDAHPDRPSLETLFEDYFQLLPDYQNIELSQLQIQRALFGVFPCYRDSPLRSPWDRMLPVGDSSGSQSPLSFGGFGAMLRHLSRLDVGIDQALQQDALSSQSLGLLQPYQPSLSVTWLFQRSMSARMTQKLDPNQINQLLTTVFAAMNQLGESTLRPFLQDVVQFPALTQTLALVSLQHPGLVSKIITQVGPLALVDWLRHYLNLGLYSGLNGLAPWLEPVIKRLSEPYVGDRWRDAWKYGSGGDYHQSHDSKAIES